MDTENYRIDQIDANTWQIDEGGVRFFLLAGTEKALLIDSGMNVHNARDIAAGLTSLPVELLNTHADMDHVGSNDQFDAVYMHPDEELNYRRGENSPRVVPVKEGDVIDLGDRPLEIIHLPGHTPGSIAVLDVVNRVLISGDPIQDGRIFMFGPARSMTAYLSSLEHLDSWSDRYDEIWPSHGDIPVRPDLVGRLRDGARDVLDGKATGKKADMFGQEIRAVDLGFATFLCDL